MMSLYAVAWCMSVLSVVFGLFGALIWLVLGFVMYRASSRSRSLAKSTDGSAASGPEVTRYARPALISTLIVFGTQACALLMVALNWATRAVGPVATILEATSGSLLVSLPAMLVALAMLVVAAIDDMRRHRRVAGRDSATALAVAFGMHAALTVWLMAGGPGIQMM